MERSSDDAELIAELRALRPAPAPTFAAELDERAAAGFPRRSPLADSRLGRLAARVRETPPRRLLLPAGAGALAAVVIAAAVVAGGESGMGTRVPSERPAGRVSAAPGAGTAAKGFDKGGADRSAYQSGTAVPSPSGEAAPSSLAASGAAAKNGSEAVAPADGPAGIAAGAAHRDVERSAEVVLGAEPADVADDAAEVFAAVHAADGVVLRSSTREGPAGEAGARFDLLIPSARLADALAAFSSIDEVRSRHDATADITAPTVAAGEGLRDSRARIDSLLAQLAAAETESEREVVEAELGRERRRAAALSSRLDQLHRRSSLSHVSLRIETGGAPVPSGQGSWGVGDALHDAGRILAIAVAVALVSFAALGPIALLALLAWLAHRAWLRRGRERALG